ncbi:hypothetical protein BD324DRAFT_619116 [Kockovaella imperatae]|uniref:Monopolin complex subunit Csm1/Pcs1 C-terminal domain-containing protein n=1 Tax=Kockovaella imperatae TaxID=4999 RepID=A0A1Y1UMP3_9TREE|nr:hypothetical protein BD324DRAFT_619116 [Kockovaella imperatae]ORX39279.1 hypothetical protein BD324DRAFT_619116 [Kockovaella imperatae]
MPAASSSSTVKRVGKENAPPKRTVKAPKDVEEDDELELSMDNSMSSEDAQKSKTDKRVAELQRRLTAMTAERDRMKTQHGTMSKQFEELSKIRKTEAESVFEKYKEKAAIQSQAQNDIISNLTALNDKLQAKVSSLETALMEMRQSEKVESTSSGPPDPKEIKALKEQLSAAAASLKRKEERLTSLDKDYKAEQDHSRSLQAQLQAAKSGTKLSHSVSTTPDEAEKDAASLRLYEDMTEMAIVNVKVEHGGKGGKEIIYNCIQTREGKSINYKLRAYNQLDPEIAKSKGDNPWVQRIRYHPGVMDQEIDRSFVSRLGVFAQEFTVKREELPSMFQELRKQFDKPDEME